jgi:4a-hydroxytetrahydrobiopterin dehydratase
MARLGEDAIDRELATVQWTREGNAIVRTLKRRDFRDAIAFVNAVADEAERRNHHPDITVNRYRTVTLRLTSHDEGGLTERDFALARAIDSLP